MSLDEIRVEGFKLAAGSRPMVVTRTSWGFDFVQRAEDGFPGPHPL
jgi:hypothetical protein